MSNSCYFAIYIWIIDLEWILQSNSIHLNRHSASEAQVVPSVCMLQAHCWQCIYIYYQNTLTSYKSWWIYNHIPKGKRLSCHSPFQRQFIENLGKLNNLPRSHKESWGHLCLLSPGPVSQDISPPWQPEPALTGTRTDPCWDLWYWITVRSKLAGTRLLFILPRLWLTCIKYLLNELEESL